MQAFNQNTGRDIAEFWKRTLSFVCDGALAFFVLFFSWILFKFPMCKLPCMQTQVPTKKINKSSFGDPQKKKGYFPDSTDLWGSKGRTKGFWFWFAYSFVLCEWTIVCGQSYFLICENLTWHVIIREYKSWVLHHNHIQLKFFLKYVF